MVNLRTITSKSGGYLVMRVATTQMPEPAMIYTDSDGEVWLVLRDGLLKPSILNILDRALGPVLCHVAERHAKVG